MPRDAKPPRLWYRKPRRTKEDQTLRAQNRHTTVMTVKTEKLLYSMFLQKLKTSNTGRVREIR